MTLPGRTVMGEEGNEPAVDDQEVIVYMANDLGDREEFPREGIKDALETIERLWRKATSLDDGLIRKIGLVVNNEVPHCADCGQPIDDCSCVEDE
jgi:hypothetical protein